MLFLRYSEAGRGDSYSARKAAEEGSEQGASSPGDTGIILAEGGGGETSQGEVALSSASDQDGVSWVPA